MSLANKLTFSRAALAAVFFIFYFLPFYFPGWFVRGSGWTAPVLILIFIVSQFTDLFDGMAARKYNETSDFGKLFDPFADTIMQLTCFLCFVIDGILPAFLFLVVIYREFGILFIRNLMLKKGITMGARYSGKVKTVSYIVAASTALLATSLQRLALFEFLIPFVRIGAAVIFFISVTISVISFFDYLSAYKKAG